MKLKALMFICLITTIGSAASAQPNSLAPVPPRYAEQLANAALQVTEVKNGSVKIEVNELIPNSNWIQNATVTIKNVSQAPVLAFQLCLFIRGNNGIVVVNHRSSEAPLLPGESRDFGLRHSEQALAKTFQHYKVQSTGESWPLVFLFIETSAGKWVLRGVRPPIDGLNE